MVDHMVGMDFGTTNSGMALYARHKGQIEILPIDPSGPNPQVARTAIYLTNDQQITIGRSAIETYMAQNTGRPVRMEKVWVGEIEVRAEDMYYVTDVYVMVDVLSPGRPHRNRSRDAASNPPLGTLSRPVSGVGVGHGDHALGAHDQDMAGTNGLRRRLHHPFDRGPGRARFEEIDGQPAPRAKAGHRTERVGAVQHIDGKPRIV